LYGRRDSQQNPILGKKRRIWRMPRRQLRNLRRNISKIWKQKRKEKTFRREELPERFMTKKLFR